MGSRPVCWHKLCFHEVVPVELSDGLGGCNSYCIEKVNMSFYRYMQVGFIACVVGFNGPVFADVVKMTFESSDPNGNGTTLQDFDPIGGYYSQKGIGFSDKALAAVDADSCNPGDCFGDFANEPSPSTTMSFLGGDQVTISRNGGFTGGLSFWYSSEVEVTVSLFDLNGVVIDLDPSSNSTSRTFAAQHTLNCVGDPTGTFCHWDEVSIDFLGTAGSLVFQAANVGRVAKATFDDIALGKAAGGNAVPEPATLMLVGAALLGLSTVRRRTP